MNEQEVRTFDTIVIKGRFALYNFPSFHIITSGTPRDNVKNDPVVSFTPKVYRARPSTRTDPLSVLFDQLSGL